MLLHMILLLALIFFSTFCTEPFEENKLKQGIYEKVSQNPKDYIVPTKLRWYSKKKEVGKVKKRKHKLNSRKN